MKAADGRDWGVSRSMNGKHDKKGWKDTPGDLCFFFLGLESTTQQKRFALWFGISFYFDKSEKEEKKTLGRGEKKKEGEKSLRVRNRATARGRGQWKPCVEAGKLILLVEQPS